MVDLLAVVFGLSVLVVLYTYAAYPILLALGNRMLARPPVGGGSPGEPVSVILAAHDEETRIASRIEELARLVAAGAAGGEVIVACDGPTDGTVAEARAAALRAASAGGGRMAVEVLVQEPRQGKAMALNLASLAAKHPLLVFADARQTWADDAIERLTAPFADPSVGAVSGDLVVESSPGVMAGVGLYWRFEKWLRRAESRLDSMVSVTGCISAARRELFPTLPPGTILDDVYWPLSIAMRGHRVVHEERARAFDRLPERARDEFRRKVRTLAGNFQLMTLMPAALLPWRNRLWWQFVSHRALRLAVPWALLTALAASALAPGALYRAALAIQVSAYLVGLAGCCPAVATRSRLASGLASFLVLNAAAWVAFWVWISGRAGRSWGKVRYHPAMPSPRPERATTRREAIGDA